MGYLHSVSLDADKCIGCTNCIKRCPTEAIRVKDGKAFILQLYCFACIYYFLKSFICRFIKITARSTDRAVIL